MASIGEQIVDLAIQILDRSPNGLHYSELVRLIEQAQPSFEHNHVVGQVVALPHDYADRVYKPSRGLYRLTKYRAPDTGELKPEFVPAEPAEIREEDFYPSFAEWLVNETGECTKAIPLGGCGFHDKWATPDVVGKFESKRGAVLSVLEIVSAEIKLDAHVQPLMTAFGQACAIFSSAIRSTLSFRRRRQRSTLIASTHFVAYLESGSSCSTQPIHATRNTRFDVGRATTTLTLTTRTNI